MKAISINELRSVEGGKKVTYTCPYCKMTIVGYTDFLMGFLKGSLEQNKARHVGVCSAQKKMIYGW